MASGQLLYNTPYVYANHFASSDLSSYPDLAKVVAKQWVKDGGSNVATFGNFTSFAKNKKWGKPLYEELVAPHYKADMCVPGDA